MPRICAQAAHEDWRQQMSKSSIWRAFLIVFAIIGVLVAIGAIGMLVMHQSMMGRLGMC